MPENIYVLPIPKAAESADKAIEMIRVWVVDQHQEIVLSTHLWKDPGTWGLLLVDIARHVASAYGERGIDRESALSRIKSAFEAEWSYPTE